MARAAALALLEQGPAPLFGLYQKLKAFDQAEVDAVLLCLEQERIINAIFVPSKGAKLKIFYRATNAAPDSESTSSTPSLPAAAKSISPALKERLERKRALMTPASAGDAKRKLSPLEQEESRLKSTIKLRKSQIEDLKRKKILAEKSANPGELERLERLSVKWGNASREIVIALKPHVGAPTLGAVLKALRIPPAMLGYSAADDDFTNDFKSLDQIDHDAEAEPVPDDE